MMTKIAQKKTKKYTNLFRFSIVFRENNIMQHFCIALYGLE